MALYLPGKYKALSSIPGTRKRIYTNKIKNTKSWNRAQCKAQGSAPVLKRENRNHQGKETAAHHLKSLEVLSLSVIKQKNASEIG